MIDSQPLPSPTKPMLNSVCGLGFGMRWRKLQIGGQLAVRAALGAGISLAIARALHMDTPIFALIAAVIVTDRDPAETRKLAIRRVISTAIGAACGVALAQVLGQSSWEAIIAIFIAMIASVAVTQLGDPKIAAYLCALIIINYSDNPWHYAFSRFIETLLGIFVAWAISLVPKLFEIAEDEDGKSEDKKRA
jgi:uncharacterized membrane protein YgaE (UPF0421/DUF939 family)